jgi:hypothetical protein
VCLGICTSRSRIYKKVVDIKLLISGRMSISNNSNNNDNSSHKLIVPGPCKPEMRDHLLMVHAILRSDEHRRTLEGDCRRGKANTDMYYGVMGRMIEGDGKKSASEAESDASLGKRKEPTGADREDGDDAWPTPAHMNIMKFHQCRRTILDIVDKKFDAWFQTNIAPERKEYLEWRVGVNQLVL